MDLCRAFESAVKRAKQMTEKSDVNRINVKGGGYQSRLGGPASHKPQFSGNRGKRRQCKFCDTFHSMSAGSCPAYGQQCNKCNGNNGLNQFAATCTENGSGVNQVDDHNVSGTQSLAISDGDIGMTAAVGYQRHGNNRARLRVHGRDKTFTLDTGATANLLSTHDVDVDQIKLNTPGRTFTM